MSNEQNEQSISGNPGMHAHKARQTIQNVNVHNKTTTTPEKGFKFSSYI